MDGFQFRSRSDASLNAVEREYCKNKETSKVANKFPKSKVTVTVAQMSSLFGLGQIDNNFEGRIQVNKFW